MRLKDLNEHDSQLDELLPALGAVAGVAGKAAGAAVQGAKAIGGAVKQGVQALGGKLAQGAQAVGQASGLAGGQMDPAQAAAAATDQHEQKKQIQDAIKQKQQELTDLQKQLADLG